MKIETAARAILAPFQHLHAYWRRLDTRSSRKWLTWLFLLAFVIACVLSVPTADAATYGYASRSDCESAAERGDPGGYSQTFDNELRLVANGTYRYYKTISTSTSCYEVPADMRRQVSFETQVHVGEVAVINAVAFGVNAKIADYTNRVIRALMIWVGWEFIRAVPGSTVPTPLTVTVAIGKHMTYTNLSDPCAAIAVSPTVSDQSMAEILLHCRRRVGTKTSLDPCERSLIYIRPPIDLIPPAPSDRFGQTETCSRDPAAYNYCGDPPNVPTIIAPDIFSPPPNEKEE